MKISIGEYKTADGKKINKVGITPDIKISQDGKAFDAGHDSVLQFAVKNFRIHDKKLQRFSYIVAVFIYQEAGFSNSALF